MAANDQLVHAEIDAKYDSLSLGGMALRNKMLITVDGNDVIEKNFAEEFDIAAITPERWLKDLIIETNFDSGDARILLSTGGVRIAAIYDSSVEKWVLDGVCQAFHTQLPISAGSQEEIDIVIALDYIRETHDNGLRG